MPWLALARIAIEMLGPWIQKWIDSLLMSAAEELKQAGYNAPSDTANIVALFERAKTKTWWPWKKRALDKCCAILVARRGEVMSAVAGEGSQPYLTRNEERELAEVVG